MVQTKYLSTKKNAEQLLNKLNNLDNRHKLFKEHAEKILNDLKDYELIYDDGINVIVKYKNNEEKENIVNYCNNNNYEYTECPREIRIMDNAISIEVKRL